MFFEKKTVVFFDFYVKYPYLCAWIQYLCLWFKDYFLVNFDVYGT